MEMLAVQSLLLILAAFLAGAMIACFLRRVFFVRANERPNPNGGRRDKVPSEETNTKIQTRSKGEAKPVSDVEAARFGRALTGAEFSNTTASVAPDDTRANDLGENTLNPVTAESVEVHAPHAPRADKKSSDPSPDEDRQSAKEASAPQATALGQQKMINVVDASQSDTPSTTVVTSEAEPTMQSDVTMLRSVRSEHLTGGDTPGNEDNIFRLPTASGADVDDLKRIRGIGVLIEKKLNAMGIRNYTQIANWTAGDVARVSETLDFKGRIERESWIEQARILASGGFTEFSRRG